MRKVGGDYSSKTCESLGAIDGALPFCSEETMRQMAQPAVVERAYLVADSGFVTMRQNPHGGPPLKVPQYYIVELPGTVSVKSWRVRRSSSP
jgi:hypothetical protein